MKSIKDIANELGVSERTIYRFIKKLDIDLSNCQTGSYGQKFYSDSQFNEICYKYRHKNNKEYFRQNLTKKDILSNTDEKYIDSLLKQLEDKDKQISYLQNHITELTEINKNFQVMLQSQTVAYLPNNKPSIKQKLLSFFSK